MKKEDEIRSVKNLIRRIKRGYITECEPPENREPGCIECLACYAVEFLEEHIENLNEV